jgi:DNA modification methylase
MTFCRCSRTAPLRTFNNVELGKRGGWRSNVWTYPGASSLGSDARRGLKDHPTVKPTAMLEDALLDLTNRGDIVFDPFLGSGSTLIAAKAAAVSAAESNSTLSTST